MKPLTSIAATAVLLFTQVTQASEPATKVEAVPERIKACVALRRDSERLGCFDRAIANLEKGVEETPTTPEDMFGANTAVNAAESDKQSTKREELQQITGVVTSLRHGDDGMMILGLDNGQTWRQQDQEVSLTIVTGDSVTVTRASFGTFRIADKRGRSARFKRVR